MGSTVEQSREDLATSISRLARQVEALQREMQALKQTAGHNH
jgi:prefoldin subunit 5